MVQNFNFVGENLQGMGDVNWILISMTSSAEQEKDLKKMNERNSRGS
jgi:hypothetical protein